MHSDEAGEQGKSFFALGGRKVSAGFLVLVSILVLGALAGVYGRGLTFTAIYLNDTFVFFDGIHRLANGQVPHIDFSSPVGWLGYWLPYAGYRIVGGYAGAIEMSSLLLAAAAVPAAALLLWRRAAPATALLVLGVIGAVTVVPLVPGQEEHMVSHAMHYNRWGWGLLIIVFLLGLPSDQPPFQAVAGIIGGLAVAALLYLKITYFAVGLGFLFLLLLYPDARRLGGIVAIVATLAFAGVVAIIYPGILFGYLQDIRDTLAASDAVRGSYLDIAFSNRTAIGLLALAGYAWLFKPRARWQDFLVVAYIALSGIAILDQNYQWTFIVSLVAAFAFLAAPGVKRNGVGDLADSIIILCGFLMVLPFAADWARVTLSYLRPPTGAHVATFETEGFDGMSMTDRWDAVSKIDEARTDFADLPAFLAYGEPTVRLTETEHVRALDDGAQLLRSTGATDAPVMTLDFTNSLSLMVDAPRRSKGYAWIHIGRNVSLDTLPDGDEMFDEIEYVALPITSLTSHSADELRKAYAGYLDAAFEGLGRSEFWFLLKRRSGAG